MKRIFLSLSCREPDGAGRSVRWSVLCVSFTLFFLFQAIPLFAADADNSPSPDKNQVKKTEVAPDSKPKVPTQEEMVRRHDQRAHLKVFSSMNEEAGAGSRGAWDKDFDVANPTPVYVQPLGNYPNSIAPAYPSVSQEPWIYNPPEDKIPEQLKQAMEGKPIQPTPDQLKQQEFNQGTYVEPGAKGESGAAVDSGTPPAATQANGAKKTGGATEVKKGEPSTEKSAKAAASEKSKGNQGKE